MTTTQNQPNAIINKDALKSRVLLVHAKDKGAIAHEILAPAMSELYAAFLEVLQEVDPTEENPVLSETKEFFEELASIPLPPRTNPPRRPRHRRMNTGE